MLCLSWRWPKRKGHGIIEITTVHPLDTWTCSATDMWWTWTYEASISPYLVKIREAHSVVTMINDLFFVWALLYVQSLSSALLFSPNEAELLFIHLESCFWPSDKCKSDIHSPFSSTTWTTTAKLRTKKQKEWSERCYSAPWIWGELQSWWEFSVVSCLQVAP